MNLLTHVKNRIAGKEIGEPKIFTITEIYQFDKLCDELEFLKDAYFGSSNIPSITLICASPYNRYPKDFILDALLNRGLKGDHLEITIKMHPHHKINIETETYEGLQELLELSQFIVMKYDEYERERHEEARKKERELENALGDLRRKELNENKPQSSPAKTLPAKQLYDRYAACQRYMREAESAGIRFSNQEAIAILNDFIYGRRA